MATLREIRRLAASHAGRFVEGTTSGGSATTLKASVLRQFPDNSLVGSYVYLRGRTAGQDRVARIISNTGDTATLHGSISPAVGAGEDFELLVASPLTINDHIDQVIQAESIGRRWFTVAVAGSPIYNADFALWTGSVPDGWTAGGTNVQRTYDPVLGLFVAEFTGSDTLTCSTSNPTQRQLEDVTTSGSLTVRAWVKGSVTVTVKAQDGSSSSESSSGSEWQRLTADLSTGTDTRLDTITLSGTSGARVALVWVEGDPALEQPLPAAVDAVESVTVSPLQEKVLGFSANLKAVDYEVVEWWPDGQTSPLSMLVWKHTPGLALLRISLVTPLSLSRDSDGVHTDTQTIPVNQAVAAYIAKRAALSVLEMLMVGSPQDQGILAARANRLRADISLARRPQRAVSLRSDL